MRHSAGRPAIGMGGGTINLWSGFASRRPALPLKQHREVMEFTPTDGEDFVKINLMVRQKSGKEG